MSKKEKIILVVLIVFVIGLSTLSFTINKQGFFSINAANLVTFLISIFIAYFFVQWRTDERNLKAKAEEIIERIQDIVNEDDSHMYTEKIDPELVLLRQRRLTNKINVLCKYCEQLNLEEDILYIKEQLAKYKELIDYHYYDYEYLNRSESQIKNYLANIDQKCDTLNYHLYVKERK